MPSKGAMRAAKAIDNALPAPLAKESVIEVANIIDRDTTADKESIIIALANSPDLNLTERQINVMRSIVESAGEE